MPHDVLPSNSRIAIVAGRGDYPIFCAENILRAGHEFVVVAVDDGINKDWYDSIPKGRAVKVEVGQIAKFLQALKFFDVRFVIMAGQIKPKKLFHGMVPDLKALRILANLKERNADSIFGAIATEIEKIGISVLDARTFMADSLATIGSMTKRRSRIDKNSLNFGINMAREIARLNIGQSIVVRKGTVLAVEDFAGTDDLIKRAAKFNVSDAIFIKTAKSNQDFRFDVPVFGMQTLENLAESNIKYVALEEGNVILLGKNDIIDQAKKHGIEIMGF